MNLLSLLLLFSGGGGSPTPQSPPVVIFTPTVPRFLTFVNAYYTFLDRPGQANHVLLNSGTWTDVDKTPAIFLPSILAQIAPDFPISVT